MKNLSVVGLLLVCTGVGAAAATFVQQRAQTTEALTVSQPETDEQTTTASSLPPGQTGGEQAVNQQPTTERTVEQRLSEVDRTLPAFELQELDDSVWTAESLKGKPWVINFWATWCPPCIEEIPSMNAAYEFLEPRGVGMLAINAGEGAIAVETFFQRIAIDFPNVLGDADTLPNWAIKALPTTIVVDADGNVVYEALGPREWDDEQLLQRVVDLL